MKLRQLIPALLLLALTPVRAQQQSRLLITPPLTIDANAERVASIAGNNLRLSYVRAGEGGRALACTMEAKVDGKWTPFVSSMETIRYS